MPRNACTRTRKLNSTNRDAGQVTINAVQCLSMRAPRSLRLAWAARPSKPGIVMLVGFAHLARRRPAGLNRKEWTRE